MPTSGPAGGCVANPPLFPMRFAPRSKKWLPVWMLRSGELGVLVDWFAATIEFSNVRNA